MKNNSRLLVSALLMAVLGTYSFADSSSPAQQNLPQFLQQLQVKLTHAAQRANKPTAQGSNVIGLRGAKQETSLSKQLYWSTVSSPHKKVAVSIPEIQEFSAAINDAQAGKMAEAIAKLNTFETHHPDSPLLPDVQLTLQKLSSSATSSTTASASSK